MTTPDGKRIYRFLLPAYFALASLGLGILIGFVIFRMIL